MILRARAREGRHRRALRLRPSVVRQVFVPLTRLALQRDLLPVPGGGGMVERVGYTAGRVR